MTTLQAPFRIGRVVQNAVAFGHGDGHLAMADSLLDTVDALFALLDERGVACVLVGGVAMLRYVEGRNTEDVDLIVAVADLRKLPEIAISSQDADFACGTFHGLRLDFLLTRNPLFDLVRRRYATMQPFAEREIRCATVEGLLLLKLYALPALYRLGNFARVGIYENDIATLLQRYRPDLTPLWKELARRLSPSDLNEVRAVVADIEARIARFERGSA